MNDNNNNNNINNNCDHRNKDSEKEWIVQKLPIRMVSTVVRGFGRGSSDLGIPTANLDCDNATTALCNKDGATSVGDLPCGIYWGFCRIGEKAVAADDAANASTGVVFKTAVSIGYNPTYGNEKKTIEPHLIANADDPRRHLSSCQETVLIDFYGEPCRLSVVGYLRPELPFEGLEKLTAAIKKDIAKAEQLADNKDRNEDVAKEEEWVGSDEKII